MGSGTTPRPLTRWVPLHAPNIVSGLPSVKQQREPVAKSADRGQVPDLELETGHMIRSLESPQEGP
jgi:hypothetical protein